MSADLHVLKARLTPSSRWDRQRAACHDFRNEVMDLYYAGREQDDRLARHMIERLIARYEEAVHARAKTKTAATAA